MAMDKRKRAASESIAFLLITAGIVVAVNLLGVFFFGRLDTTENDLFSLSEGSKKLVAGLEDRMEVTAYFTEDLPPPFNATERAVRDLLAEYENASGGNMRVKFVNPDGDETRAQAEREGVQRVAHQKIEKSSIKVEEGYRGLVFSYLGERKTIATIGDTKGLEYTITQTLRDLLGDRTEVGVLSGHEGPTLAEGLSTLQKLLPTYAFSEVDASEPIDGKYKALLIVDPSTEIADEELRNIDAYVMKGGSLGVFGGAMQVKQEQGAITGSPVQNGLEKLLGPWGVKLQPNLVADAQCGQVPMRTPFGISLPVPFPPVPIVSISPEEAQHPALYKLDQIFLPFGSSLQLTDSLKGEQDISTRVLARSSENSWLLKGDAIDLKPREPREWRRSGEPGPFPLVLAIEGKLTSAFTPAAMSAADGAQAGPAGPGRAEQNVHVLISGSSGFVRDEYLPQPQPGREVQLNGALAFALNAIDWLAQEDALIAIRAKNLDEPMLEVPASVQLAEDEAQEAYAQQDQAGTEAALERRQTAIADWDSRKVAYQWGNVLGVPLLLALFGLVRWRRRQARRASLTLD